MKEILNTLGRSSRALSTNKSNLRVSLEKSTRIYIAPVAILAATMLILDGITTWKQNMR